MEASLGKGEIELLHLYRLLSRMCLSMVWRMCSVETCISSLNPTNLVSKTN
jgi:hypothetical protein